MNSAVERRQRQFYLKKKIEVINGYMERCSSFLLHCWSNQMWLFLPDKLAMLKTLDNSQHGKLWGSRHGRTLLVGMWLDTMCLQNHLAISVEIVNTCESFKDIWLSWNDIQTSYIMGIFGEASKTCKNGPGSIVYGSTFWIQPEHPLVGDSMSSKGQPHNGFLFNS